MLRQNQRALNKAMRDLDRERQRMEQQEKKVIADIKKMAKQGQQVRQSPQFHGIQKQWRSVNCSGTIVIVMVGLGPVSVSFLSCDCS